MGTSFIGREKGRFWNNLEKIIVFQRTLAEVNSERKRYHWRRTFPRIRRNGFRKRIEFELAYLSAV